MNKIYEIFKQYKRSLLFIYLFMLITELANLATPFLLGKSIDGLMNGVWYWTIFLGFSYFLSAFFNYKRMVYDTKIYTRIYNSIVFQFLQQPNHTVSTKMARTEMAHDIVGVLEGYIHYYIATIITIIGSLIFIYSANWQVGVLVSVAFVIILTAVFVYYHKIKQSIKLKNTHYERKADALHDGYQSSIQFFNRRRQLEIFESTLQGKNWLLVLSIKSAFLLSAIILLVLTTKHVTIGSVITVYSYVNNFLVALMSVPVATEMYTRLSDILKRIQ